MDFKNIPSGSEDVNHIAYYYVITQTDERSYLSLANQNETERESIEASNREFIEELISQPGTTIEVTSTVNAGAFNSIEERLERREAKSKDEEEESTSSNSTFNSFNLAYNSLLAVEEKKASKEGTGIKDAEERSLFWRNVLMRMNYNQVIPSILFPILDRLNDEHFLWVCENIEGLRSYVKNYPRFVHLVSQRATASKSGNELGNSGEEPALRKPTSSVNEAEPEDSDRFFETSILDARAFNSIEESLERRKGKSADENKKANSSISSNSSIEYFNPFVEVPQNTPLSLSDEEIEEYAKKRFSEIRELHIDLESMKRIALKKLETLEIGMLMEMKRRLFEAQLQRHLSNFERRHILGFEDIQEAFYCILNQQAMVHLKSFKDSLSISISEEKPILIFNSLDLDIQAFCKRWNEEFVEEYKNIGGLHMFRACLPGVGYFRMVQFIIAVSEDRKKKVNEVHSEITALIIAVQGGHLKIVRELIVAGADINYRGLLGHTLLFTAILEGHLEIAQELIAAGADVNCRNKKGFTALCRAAGAGYLAIVQKLIAAGADVNHKDEDGLTALFYATSNLEIAQELIAAGADVNHVDEEGFTALFGAVQGGHLEIVKELIAAGTDINHSNKKELTALYMAANKGYLEIVRELIAKKASVNQRSEDGATALIVAAYKGYLEIVRELINAKADVNQGDKDGLTSLFDAVRNGHLDVVRELIAAGADVNQEYGDVATPLLQAVSNRNYEMAKFLLELGADMHAENSKQLSPFKLSFQRGRTKIKNLFLEFQRKLKGKEAAPAQVKYTTTYEKQPGGLLEKKEVQREPEDIKYTAEKYIFTEEDEKAAEELGVDLEIEMESIKKSFYTEEWTLDIEKSFQERWSSDRGNKKLKQAKLSDSQKQDQALRLPTDKLSGEKLKLRQGLIAILVDQPKNIHKDIIRTVVERLGGKVEEDTRNRHRVYLRGGNQNKNTLKYVGFYEVRHDKDPKNCLTRRYLKRVAIILERAIRLKLIDPRLLAYFPEKWEGSNSLEKRHCLK